MSEETTITFEAKISKLGDDIAGLTLDTEDFARRFRLDLDRQGRLDGAGRLDGDDDVAAYDRRALVDPDFLRFLTAGQADDADHQ